MDSDGKYYQVQQGETTTGLAFDHGLHWKTIWDHPNNQQLRSSRKHPNILRPGDVIFIPNLRRRHEDKTTDKRHQFVRKGVPEKFNMRFLDLEGRPYANEPYLLTVNGCNMEGKLDADGWVRVALPPNASSGRILVGQDGILAACDLHFGSLDPLSDLSGVQARLRNLGYYDGDIDGEDGEALQAAVNKFRQDEGLSEDGGIGDDFRDRLEKRHYS
jgi:hypothetical protein